MAHGNRGRPPAAELEDELSEEILRPARRDNLDYNDTHFTVELAERYGIAVSSPTVRLLRRAHGSVSSRKRSPPRHCRSRQCYPQSEVLLQVDGIKYDCLEGCGPWLALHEAIDDATNEVPWAVFRQKEDAYPYHTLHLTTHLLLLSEQLRLVRNDYSG